MALFSECMQLCAQKVLDTADIVRDGVSPLRSPCANSCILGFGGSREFGHLAGLK